MKKILRSLIQQYPQRQPQDGETIILLTQDPILYKDLSNKTLQDAISRLQNLLRTRGYLKASSGIFDQETELAVKAFQEDNNLLVDGVVGALTWACLRYPVLHRHSRNLSSDFHVAATKDLQALLKVAGFHIRDPEGQFGQSTERAVKRFQRWYGLKPDGIAGALTWSVLLGMRPSRRGSSGELFLARRSESLFELIDLLGTTVLGDFWRVFYLSLQDAFALGLIFYIVSLMTKFIIGKDFSSFNGCIQESPFSISRYVCFINVSVEFVFWVLLLGRIIARFLVEIGSSWSRRETKKLDFRE